MDEPCCERIQNREWPARVTCSRNTENRSVLHACSKGCRHAVTKAGGKNVVPEVWNVLDKIKEFSETIGSR